MPIDYSKWDHVGKSDDDDDDEKRDEDEDARLGKWLGNLKKRDEDARRPPLASTTTSGRDEVKEYMMDWMRQDAAVEAERGAPIPGYKSIRRGRVGPSQDDGRGVSDVVSDDRPCPGVCRSPGSITTSLGMSSKDRGSSRKYVWVSKRNT